LPIIDFNFSTLHEFISERKYRRQLIDDSLSVHSYDRLNSNSFTF